MYRQIPLEALGNTEFVPQAIIGRSIHDLTEHMHLHFAAGQDDLDAYEAAAVAINNMNFVIKRYKGYPENTVTIYLPITIEKTEEVSSVIAHILRELWISPEWIIWQRSDAPDL